MSHIVNLDEVGCLYRFTKTNDKVQLLIESPTKTTAINCTYDELKDIYYWYKDGPIKFVRINHDIKVTYCLKNENEISHFMRALGQLILG